MRERDGLEARAAAKNRLQGIIAARDQPANANVA